MCQKFSKIIFNYELWICLNIFGFLKFFNIKVHVSVKESNEMIPETEDKEACDLKSPVQSISASCPSVIGLMGERILKYPISSGESFFSSAIISETVRPHILD